jgi:CheY-like chemotaxis protein
MALPDLDFLIVDDDEATRGILDKALRAAGATKVRAAEDAISALALMAAAPADVVISDLMMPGMDGLEFVAALRAAHAKAHILILTGYANMADQARAAGANAVLQKPLAPAALVLAVQAALG